MYNLFRWGHAHSKSTMKRGGNDKEVFFSHAFTFGEKAPKIGDTK